MNHPHDKDKAQVERVRRPMAQVDAMGPDADPLGFSVQPISGRPSLKAARKALTCIAGLASMMSGLFWLASAQIQSDTIQGPPAAAETIAKLEIFSAQINVWAAFGASAAGIALSLMLLLEAWAGD